MQDIFDINHDEFRLLSFGYHHSKKWYFMTMHSSGYVIMLQWDLDLDKPMIRAGCRYYTLAQARRHWARKDHHRGREACAEVLMLIGSLVRRAKSDGCLDRRYKFNETLPPLAKTRKKVAKRAKAATRRRRR